MEGGLGGPGKLILFPPRFPNDRWKRPSETVQGGCPPPEAGEPVGQLGPGFRPSGPWSWWDRGPEAAPGEAKPAVWSLKVETLSQGPRATREVAVRVPPGS